MNKKSFILLAVVLMLVGLGLYLIREGKVFKQVSEDNNNFQQETETNRWDKYEDDVLGYSVSFPVGWWDSVNKRVINPSRAGLPDTDIPIEALSISKITKDNAGSCVKNGEIKINGYDLYDSGWEVGMGNVFYKTLCQKDGKLRISISIFDGENGDLDERSKNIFDKILASIEFYAVRPADDSEYISSLSEYALSKINDNDFQALSGMIHPIKGVRISLDGYINNDDVILKADQLDYLTNNNIKLLWGYSDGMGKPIIETVGDFLNKYIKFDYKNVNVQNAYNKVLRGGSAGGSNLRDIYKTQNFMSYYIPYTETYNNNGVEVPQTMGWTAINFVFEESNGKTFLIGIVKDNWTI